MKVYKKHGATFIGFMFVFVRDHLINHLEFLFMCFTGQRSLGRRLRLKLTDAHDKGMAKGGCQR
jgi:hypothetical protein